MPDILHLIAIKAPPATVYAALTEQKGFAGWWTTDTKAAPEVGAVDQFRSAQRGGSDMKVAELVPRRRVRWQCLDGAKESIRRRGVSSTGGKRKARPSSSWPSAAGGSRSSSCITATRNGPSFSSA